MNVCGFYGAGLNGDDLHRPGGPKLLHRVLCWDSSSETSVLLWVSGIPEKFAGLFGGVAVDLAERWY